MQLFAVNSLSKDEAFFQYQATFRICLGTSIVVTWLWLTIPIEVIERMIDGQQNILYYENNF